jgi:hypothetical protein
MLTWRGPVEPLDDETGIELYGSHLELENQCGSVHLKPIGMEYEPSAICAQAMKFSLTLQ